MSSLSTAEKAYLEKLLNMSTGWVLDLPDAKFGELFNRFNVAIHSEKYQTTGSSKARKMRSFWEQEPDPLVGSVLSELLDTYEAECDLKGMDRDILVLDKCQEIVGRLRGQPLESGYTTVEGFLRNEFELPNVQNLPIDFFVAEIIQQRLEEAHLCLSNGAHLSVIFLCGSILEGVLLGAAQGEPEKFNRSSVSPKHENRVKPFHRWSLAEFIDVALDIGLLKPDIQKFGHGLRDFRNYIHPYQQMSSGFTPDEHTAKVCYQVLKAALASIAGER